MMVKVWSRTGERSVVGKCCLGSFLKRCYRPLIPRRNERGLSRLTSAGKWLVGVERCCLRRNPFKEVEEMAGLKS